MDQTKKQPKSFLEIIKEDPSRTKELLNAAVSIFSENEISLADDDEIDDGEVDDARNRGEMTLDQPKWPTVIIPVRKINRFITKKTTGIGDLLIFYLATYKNQKQVDRYNRRNGTTWTLDDLKGRPTIILQSLSNYNKPHLREKLGDLCSICPPPKGECYKNN